MQESLNLRVAQPSIASWKSIALIIGFAVLTAVASKFQFYFWFSPVPVTLQSLAISLGAVALGSRRAVISQLALIGMGLVGLPVFSSPLPGFAVMAGPTGGYILGFLLCAFVTGVLFEQKRSEIGFFKSSFYFLIGSLFIFLPGVVWLSVYTGASIGKALLIGFVPFIAGDVLKCMIAAATMRSVRSNL